MPLPALRYLMNNGVVKNTSDWSSLNDKDKDDLKRWADEEQKALGL